MMIFDMETNNQSIIVSGFLNYNYFICAATQDLWNYTQRVSKIFSSAYSTVAWCARPSSGSGWAWVFGDTGTLSVFFFSKYRYGRQMIVFFCTADTLVSLPSLPRVCGVSFMGHHSSHKACPITSLALHQLARAPCGVRGRVYWGCECSNTHSSTSCTLSSLSTPVYNGRKHWQWHVSFSCSLLIYLLLHIFIIHLCSLLDVPFAKSLTEQEMQWGHSLATIPSTLYVLTSGLFRTMGNSNSQTLNSFPLPFFFNGLMSWFLMNAVIVLFANKPSSQNNTSAVNLRTLIEPARNE